MNVRFLIAAWLTVLAGCASSPFHDHFEAGRYAQASSAFEENASLHDQERALYRSGLMHAIPDSEVHDSERAREDLEQLLELYPESQHRGEAKALLGLLSVMTGLEEELEAADAEARRQERELADLRAQLADRNDELGEARGELRERERRYRELESELVDVAERLRTVRNEMEQLKEIDLGQPPR